MGLAAWVHEPVASTTPSPFPRCPPPPPKAPTVTGSTPWGAPATVEAQGSGGFRSHHQNPPMEPCTVLPRTAYCVPRVCSVTSLVAHQVPLSMGFSRQEYWNGLSFPPSGDLPHPGIKPCISWLGHRHCQILETTLCSSKIPALSPCEDPKRHQEREAQLLSL